MQTMQIKRGSDISFHLIFKDSQGAPLNITGYTIFFTVKSKLSDEDSEALIKKDISAHTIPAEGKSVLQLTHTETDLPGSTYFFDFKLKDVSGNISPTDKGHFVIVETVTKRTS